MPGKSMTELREMVGQSNRTVEALRVEAGKVEEFARAVESSNPHHRTSDDDDKMLAPLTFPRTGYFPRYRPDGMEQLHDDEAGTYFGFELDFDSDRTVHGEQAYEYERPLAVGDVVDGETKLDDVSQREGSSGMLIFAEFKTTYTDVDDEVVLVERTTFIETPAGGETGDKDGN